MYFNKTGLTPRGQSSKLRLYLKRFAGILLPPWNCLPSTDWRPSLLLLRPHPAANCRSMARAAFGSVLAHSHFLLLRLLHGSLLVLPYIRLHAGFSNRPGPLIGLSLPTRPDWQLSPVPSRCIYLVKAGGGFSPEEVPINTIKACNTKKKKKIHSSLKQNKACKTR